MLIKLKIIGYCVSLYKRGKVIRSGIILREDKATALLSIYRTRFPKLFSYKRPIYGSVNN
jgi:hypothetical protein